MPSSQLFTITYIYKDTNEKIILMTSGDSLNEASEAEYILSSTNPEEVELVDFIVEAIGIFKMSEPGSKESITHTAEDFQALYDLPFNEIEEQADEVVSGTTLLDVEELLAYTDPNEYISERTISSYTEPADYMEEEDEIDIPYAPVLTESDENEDLQVDALISMDAHNACEGEAATKASDNI